MTISGISFPFTKGTTSFPAGATDEDVIADNIKRLLQTTQGARVMRPATGSGVIRFTFESMGPILNARISHEVRRAIADGEPRASVLSVNVVEEERRDGDRNVVVTVNYEVNLRPGSVTVSFGG